MNVEIKPLVWGRDGANEVADTPITALTVFRERSGDRWGWSAANFLTSAVGFPTVDAAKLAADRWYTLRVLDCLEPADPDAALALLTLRDQCMGLCD
jgi:hypothetical protein